jgi:acetyltransferase-like isoleucine patch superfamily enzyme
MISAVAGNIIEIGDDVLIAPNTYIGGVSYKFERTDIPISHQGKAPQGGIRIGENCWLGARVLVLDGVNIGHDSILAAGAVVTQDIPPFSIAMGVPAKVTKSRKE